MNENSNLFTWVKRSVILLTCVAFFILLVAYSDGYLLLGGEGNYITDFKVVKNAGVFAWVSHIQGLGFPNPIVNTLRGIFDLFALLQNFTNSLALINIFSAWLVYVLPFLSMFWLLKKILKMNFAISYCVALFYVVNPYSVFHLQGLMFWNVAPLFLFPLVFGILHRYYRDGLKLFLFFGILTSVLSFAISNIPYLGVFQFFLVLSLIIVPYLQEKKFHAGLFIKNFIIIELSFILFNAWWLLNLIRFQAQDLGLYYTKEFALNWVASYVGNGGMIAKLFTLTSLISSGTDNFLSIFYYSFPINLLLILPFGMLLFSFLQKKDGDNSEDKPKILILLSAILVIMFFAKGAGQPFGFLYIWMLKHVPFFIIFKSPGEKFSLLFIFLLSLAMVFVLKSTPKKWAYCLFVIYLVACSIPYFSLYFMPDFLFDKGPVAAEDKYISRKYLYKESYFAAAESLNKQQLECRYLGLPGSANYQETLYNHDGNKYYRGMSPLVYSVNKSFITSYASPILPALFFNLSNDYLENLLGMLNIKKVVINKDLYPSFGKVEKESTSELIDIFSNKYSQENFKEIQIFNLKKFLPLIYVPRETKIVKNFEEIIKTVLSDDYKPGAAMYFEDKLSKLDMDFFGRSKSAVYPTIEFKKINPIKYRIILHKTRGEFPLIFNETFHAGWKLYLTDTTKSTTIKKEDILTRYKILDGNADEQADANELEEYIDTGVISFVGDQKEKSIKHWGLDGTNKRLEYVEKHTVDYVSKNNYGTIQNDNLLDGTFYETWRLQPMTGDSGHLLVNGFSNSWTLNIDEICASKSACKKNSDGTYDMELILEFSPQRLLYYGAAITAATLFLTIAALCVCGLMKKYVRK